MCGGLIAQILILLQTTFIHLVKQTCDRRKLIKVEAVTQSYLWTLSVSTREPLIEQIVTRGRQLTKAVLWAFSLSIVDLFLFPFLDFVTNTQFQRLSFPNCGNDEYRISRASLLPYTPARFKMPAARGKTSLNARDW